MPKHTSYRDVQCLYNYLQFSSEKYRRNRQIEKLCEERYKCAKSELINAFDVIQCFRNFDTFLEKYK